MSNEQTRISWADKTWNPVSGCSRVSEGCRNCYAEALSLRFGTSTKPWTHVNAAENVVLHPKQLDVPLHWRAGPERPWRIFVNSMSDLFHEQIPDSFIAQVFAVMQRAHWHTYQVLTKRPERMARLCRDLLPLLPNVWLGASCERQREADQRIPHLLSTPAAVRFLSCEPLLAPIDLSSYLTAKDPSGRRSRQIDQVIVGGESGPHHRPMPHDWARVLRDQCQATGVAFFFKQSSAYKSETGCELDGRTWHEFPDEVPSAVLAQAALF